MSGIGLVVALPREIPTGFVRIRPDETVPPRPFALYRDTSLASQLVAVQAGVGCRCAVAGARLLIQRFAPAALVSFGFAGGLLPQLQRGALIIGTALVCSASAKIMAEAHRSLIDQFYGAAEAEGLPVQKGPVVTTQHIVAEVASKIALRQHSGAFAVDMETAGMVQAACEAGIPWVAVRAIVDCATDPLPAECLATFGNDGQLALGLLLRTICRSPALLRHLLRLARDTALARRRLSRIVERWALNTPTQSPLAGG